MCDEISLQGGRITQGVVRKGNYVLRPCCSNSSFAHNVLKWLEDKGVTASPRFIGLTGDGREITTFLEGVSPYNLGWFSEEQIFEAARIIKHLHSCLSDFPGCSKNQTVCHNDLSPCNFMFKDGLPYAVFDWDAAGIGDPVNDVAYAVWLWLDIGNEQNSVGELCKKTKIMLDAYGLDIDRKKLIPILHKQMQRVAKSLHVAGISDGYKWACGCERWLTKHQSEYVIT